MLLFHIFQTLLSDDEQMQTSVRRSKLNLAAELEVPDVEETLSLQQITVVKDVSPHK